MSLSVTLVPKRSYPRLVPAPVSSPLAVSPSQAPVTAPMTNERLSKDVDVYFSVDVETDGPIPGPYSMLSFGLVVAGTFDGRVFKRLSANSPSFVQSLALLRRENSIVSEGETHSVNLRVRPSTG